MDNAAKILQRVQRRLEIVGMSAHAASLAAGAPSAIPNLKKRANAGLVGPGWAIDRLKKIVAVLKTTEQWLLTGQGLEEAEQDIRSEDVAATLSASAEASRHKIYIKGYVGASGEGAFYKYADDSFDFIEATSTSSDLTIAFEIRGVSFGPLVQNWLALFDDVRSPITEDLIGEVCIVGLPDDRVLLKEVRRASGGKFNLLSNSGEPPIEGVQIEWAAPVNELRPRRTRR